MTRGSRIYAGGILVSGPPRGARIYAGGILQGSAPHVSLTTEYNGTFSATLKGASGSVFFDWGGGEYEEFVLTAGGVACTHVYSDASSKEIKIYGALDSVTYLESVSMGITAIANFILFTALTDLVIHSNSIDDISPIESLTSLTYLNIRNNSIDDISPLAGLTSMLYLYIYDNIIVDISPLAGLTALIILRANNNPVTYPPAGISWPAWDGTEYRLDSIVTTDTEVNRMLIDFAAGGMNNCQLLVAGTNPARTSASDAAMGTLITNNVTVTVNT